MSAKSDLYEITVVIFSRNRHFALKQTLPYWGELPVKVLVLDDSKSDLNMGNLPNNIFYNNYRQPIRQRFFIAEKLIKTPYTIIVSDDEIILWSGLEKMLTSLKNDPSLSCVGGMVLGIWKFGRIICGQWAYQNSKKLMITGNSTESRLQSIYRKNGESLIWFMYYNLFNSDVLKEVLLTLGTLEIEASDGISLLLPLAYGNVYYLDELYLIRNWNKPIKSTPQVDRGFSLKKWMKNNSGMNKERELAKIKFAFNKINSRSNFDESWSIVLDILDPKQVVSKKQLNPIFTNQKIHRLRKWCSYLTKIILSHDSLPKEYIEILSVLRAENISFDLQEVERAVKIISKI